MIKLGKLLCRLQIYQYENYVTVTLCIIMLRCCQVTVKNKCIGDDTKAAARQSLNCVKNKNKIKYGENDFQYGGWNSYTLQCGTIMTLISSGDCTLQYGMWLWNCDSEFIKWQQPAM